MSPIHLDRQNSLRLVKTLEYQPSSEDVLAWSMADAGEAVQGPLDLGFLRGKVLQLVLQERQVALQVEDGRLLAVFLEGNHTLRIGPGAGELSPGSEIVFLNLASSLELSWKGDAHVLVREGDEEPRELRLVGECACRIAAPEAFYAAFLRHAEHEGPHLTRRVLDALIRARIEQHLGELAAERQLDPDRFATELERLGPEDVAPGLGRLGLSCQALAVRAAGKPSPAAAPETAGQSGESRVNRIH